MEMLMAGQSSDDLLAMFDSAPLNRRYWISFGLLSAITVLDFFDFFLIAFILSKIGPEWQLTYGQSGLILYGGGIGAILGALVWGSLSDVLGRKLQIVTGTLICAVSAALIGALPTGAWILLASSDPGWLRACRRGDALPDDRCRADADPLAHRDDELLHRVRQRRDIARLGDLGRLVQLARLARPSDTRHCPGPLRFLGLGLCAGIGALADR
jgi:hypothetical protein